MDVSDYLWNMYNEHTSQGWHHEAQRTAVSTVVLALAGAVVAVIAQGHFQRTWPLAVIVGTRVPVSVILDCLAAGMAAKGITAEYPTVTVACARRPPTAPHWRAGICFRRRSRGDVRPPRDPLRHVLRHLAGSSVFTWRVDDAHASMTLLALTLRLW